MYLFVLMIFKYNKIMENLNNIREQLPHGAMKEIAKRANVSNATVTKVLDGTCENLVVINAIADYLTVYKAEKELAVGRLASLIK